MTNELLYQLALTQIPNIGDHQVKILIEHFGSASDIFKARKSELEKVEGIGSMKASSIKNFDDFSLVEQELKFLEKTDVKPLFLTDNDYPKRLLHCNDAPSILFYRGSANLNTSKILSVVGTRSYSEYGKQFTENLIREISSQKILIVSGLAYGIDAFAHKAAIKYGLPTVGVVAHGIDTIYPALHAGLSKDMLEHGGGILTEFFSGIQPDRHHFPLRNRIVAGMADATIVIETHIKGGSMITANLAFSYNRDVFAIPGRHNDKASQGCNELIKNNQAILLTDATQLLNTLGWNKEKKEPNRQRELFISLTPEEEKIVSILQEKGPMHIDMINLSSGLSMSHVAAAMLNLELQNVIVSMPGKMYQLN